MKKQKYRTIKEYSSHKLIRTLTGSNNSMGILVCTDDPEEWFIQIVSYYKRSGVIVDSYTVIEKDYPDHLNYLKDLGYRSGMKRTKFN